jgi:hypothetical protein
LQLRYLHTWNRQIDETNSLITVKPTLSQAARFVASAHDELNEILGGCARRSRLAYDKANSLMLLVEEVGKVVVPMLQRVESIK